MKNSKLLREALKNDRNQALDGELNDVADSEREKALDWQSVWDEFAPLRFLLNGMDYGLRALSWIGTGGLTLGLTGIGLNALAPDNDEVTEETKEESMSNAFRLAVVCGGSAVLFSTARLTLNYLRSGNIITTKDRFTPRLNNCIEKYNDNYKVSACEKLEASALGNTAPLSIKELSSMNTICYLVSKNGHIDRKNRTYNYIKQDGQLKSVPLTEPDYLLLSEALQHRKYLNQSLTQFSFEQRFNAGNKQLLTPLERHNNKQWIQRINNQQANNLQHQV